MHQLHSLANKQHARSFQVEAHIVNSLSVNNNHSKSDVNSQLCRLTAVFQH